MDEEKQRVVNTNFASIYSCFIPHLREVAREHGYALAVHGSMCTDLDLVCVPWVDEVSSPDDLIKAFCNKYNALLPAGNDPGHMPHGRLTYSLVLSGEMYLDISIMTGK